MSTARHPHLDHLPAALRAPGAAQWQNLYQLLGVDAERVLQHPALAGSLPLVFASSEFVAQACLRDAALLPRLLDQGSLLTSIDVDWLRNQLAVTDLNSDLDSLSDAGILARLRQFRRQQMVRIAWRDIAGMADLNETLLDLSNLADVCVQYVNQRAYAQLTALYGTPRGRDSGAAQSLLVLAMGKLGGRELNYSSDIDLIFLYPETGQTDGAAVLANEEFFLRLGQRLIQWLSSQTADGFVFRVDMRLRPFGDSGPLAVSFDSFEAYLQQNGRDWERYAFVKARPITNIEQYAALYHNVIRPFVYRRYLDFSVFESLRTMKQMIAREVARRELHQHVKLGPGGIREVEFIVQAFQLLRGGNDRQLQARELQQVLPRLVGHKLLSPQAVAELLHAYRFLRLVENRLQQWSDNNTHYLPEDEPAQLRLAVSLNYADWTALSAELNAHRQRVSHWFATIVFGQAETAGNDPVLDGFLDANISDAERLRAVQSLGIVDAQHITRQMLQVRDSGYYRRLDVIGRQRLHVLVPKVLRLIGQQAEPMQVFKRILRIVEMIGGRTVYLALLNEHPPVLKLLVSLCAQSEFLAEQVAAFPLLLDELIDARLMNDLPTRASLAEELQLKLAHADPDDEERQVELLREFQRIALFRIAVADLTGRMPLMRVSDRLTDLAELIVQQALYTASSQLIARHGNPQCGVDAQSLRSAGVVVVGYGKLGGIELGYGSDLDLVFLHDSAGEYQQTSGKTDGSQSVDNSTFFARLGQRLVHLLTTHSRAGRLYEVDIRLRPNGKGGLLVQSLSSFAAYQRKEAWTWEHQALLRARAVAGDAQPVAQFEQIRTDVLRKAIKRDTLCQDVRKMRQRMRDELSKAGKDQFDLKQDAGGIADIEFLVQYWMLKWADDYPPIILFTDNIRQLESLESGNIVPQPEVDFLTSTYRLYRQRMHHLSLAGGDGLIAADEFMPQRARVMALWDAAMNG
jgi:[glutamine synthetase] adenylyltransferase / [glutamine synthetase]-adenylyl-L-tyrosine phosphorylase